MNAKKAINCVVEGDDSWKRWGWPALLAKWEPEISKVVRAAAEANPFDLEDLFNRSPEEITVTNVNQNMANIWANLSDGFKNDLFKYVGYLWGTDIAMYSRGYLKQILANLPFVVSSPNEEDVDTSSIHDQVEKDLKRLRMTRYKVSLFRGLRSMRNLMR